MYKSVIILSLFFILSHSQTTFSRDLKREVREEKPEEYIKDIMETLEPVKPLLEKEPETAQPGSDYGAKTFQDYVTQGSGKTEKPSVSKDFVESYIKLAVEALEPLKDIIEKKDPGSFQSKTSYGPENFMKFLGQASTKNQAASQNKDFVGSYINQAMEALEPLKPLIAPEVSGSFKLGERNGAGTFVDTISQTFDKGEDKSPAMDKGFVGFYVKQAMEALEPLKPLFEQKRSR